MKILQGEVWLSFDELKSVGVKEKTLEMGTGRNALIWQSQKNPDDGRKRLIRYNTLADKYKELVKTNLCGGFEPLTWIRLEEEQKAINNALDSKGELLDSIELMCTERFKFNQYLYPGVNNPHLKCLCRGAGILQVIVDWYEEKDIPYRDHKPVKIVAEWLKNNMNDYFPIKYLPANPLRLMEKVKAYGEQRLEITDIICQPRLGNDNRATHKKEKWWQIAAITLRKDAKNYTQAQIYRRLVLMADNLDKECPAEITLRRFLSSKEHLTVSSHTDLNNKLRQRHRSSMDTARAMRPNDCWEMDGTQVQFVGHLTGNKGKSGKAETKGLYVVAVRDVYSGAYLGYWYGYAESENAYRHALKMAVEVTGCLPVELRYDQFPGSTSKGWRYLAGTKDETGLLQGHGVRVTKTSKSTGKAFAERAFYTLQQCFESETKQYLGQGIKSSLPHARPTEAFIAKTQKEFLNNGWNYDQAWMEHAQVIATYNHTPFSKYSKKYANQKRSPWETYEIAISESNGRKVKPLEITNLFWNARSEGIRQNRIEFKVGPTTYRYYIEVSEFELLEYQREGVKVIVRHEPFDYSKIMVFNQSEVFLAELHESQKIQLYGETPDWEAAAKWKQQDKALNDRKKLELKEFDLTDEVAAMLPTLTEKVVYNDAQTAYAYRNAGEWVAVKPEPKPRKKDILSNDSDDFDPEEFIFNQR
jgi:hypothetical protein